MTYCLGFMLIVRTTIRLSSVLGLCTGITVSVMTHVMRLSTNIVVFGTNWLKHNSILLVRLLTSLSMTYRCMALDVGLVVTVVVTSRMSMVGPV